MFIDVYCHIIDKMTKATKILKNLMLFNRGINTVKITALSNNKPGKLNNYIRINILIIKTIHLITGTKLFSASSRTFTFVISVKGHVMVTVASIKCLLIVASYHLSM